MEITKALCCLCLISVTFAGCGTADNEQALEQGSQRAQLYCENHTEDECIQDSQCSPVYAADSNTGDPTCDPNTNAGQNCQPSEPTFVGCEPAGNPPTLPPECDPATGQCECVRPDGTIDPNCPPPPPPPPPPCACDGLAEDECIAHPQCDPEYAQCVPSEPPPGCASGDPNCANAPQPPPDECNGNPQYVGCRPHQDECLLDFICPDGSLPQGSDCWCPPWPCNDPSDPNCGCVRADGSIDPNCPPPPPPPCDQTNGDCQCVLPDGSWDPSCPPPPPPPCDATTDPNCPPPPPPPCDAATGQCGCVLPDGQVVQPGESISPDGCNTCWCEPDGNLVCTQQACQCPADFICPDGSAPGPNCECPPPPPPPCDPATGQCGCELPDGQWVPVGAAFPAPDGCNVCVCDQNGDVVCTEIACGNNGSGG